MNAPETPLCFRIDRLLPMQASQPSIMTVEQSRLKATNEQ